MLSHAPPPLGRARLALARGVVAVLAVLAYRLARCVVAGLGLAALLGPAWGALLVLLIAVAGGQWMLRLAAFLTLMRLWHWPWLLALPVAVPRLLLVLPGLIHTALARLRHPRPSWTPFEAPGVPPAAMRVAARPDGSDGHG